MAPAARLTSDSNRSPTTVAAVSAGNYVVVWESTAQDGDGQGVYAQRFHAAGTANGP